MPFDTPPAYVSLVDEKNSVSPRPGSHASTFSSARVFTRITRAGSRSTLRTPTTAASMYTCSQSRARPSSAPGRVRSAC